MSNLKLQLIKTSLTFGALFTPHRVMNYFWDKMFTTRKRSLKPPHTQILDTAKKGRFETTLFNNKPATIQTYSWGTGKQTILLLHGWESKAADYYKFIPLLLQQGYKVLSLDFPAHGNSDQIQTSLPEFIKVVRQYMQVHPEIEAIVAHSLGGTAAATWLGEQTNAKVKQLIMVGSPIIPKNFFEGAFNFFGVRHKVRTLFYAKARSTFGKGIEDFALANALTTTNKATQVHGVYDIKDQVVSIDEVKIYANQNPAIHMQYFDGVGHHQMIKHPEVLQACLDILAQA
ncbi:alpha/beta hydrolase [uncultured Microscilla sp.]|uniref:alpha/beta fold hydrolase n=1 Tax=uncultured Microscilla sp. TaxID=432653 RepID=UPI002616AF08|nr:alpha/beta hydrolase [uncultured Microscilla sp.]